MESKTIYIDIVTVRLFVGYLFPTKQPFMNHSKKNKGFCLWVTNEDKKDVEIFCPWVTLHPINGTTLPVS